MKVLYISTFVNNETIESINSRVNKGSEISFAAIKYADLIRRGLDANKNISLQCVFSPSIGSYKKTGVMYYKPIISPRSPKGKYISCPNFAIIKQFFITICIFISGSHWFFANVFSKDKYIIFSSIQLPFLLGVLPLKLFGVKVISFIPDLPEYQYKYTKLKGKLENTILPIYIYLCKKLYSIISYYIFITKYMANKFPSRPHYIMEGLVDLIEINNSKTIKPQNFTIMYAGSLYESMGIGTLLDAIDLISDTNLIFLFFGNGDMVDKIFERQKRDKRIIYGGIVSNDSIIDWEKKAHLMINPRSTSKSFTKYSFPSKLMEYMLSGTPVLTTRLKGIPKDYSDKMYFIEEETPLGIKKAIEICLAKSKDELIQKGEEARNYVFSEKNYVHQLEKIVKNISSTFSKNA